MDIPHRCKINAGNDWCGTKKLVKKNSLSIKIITLSMNGERKPRKPMIDESDISGLFKEHRDRIPHRIG